jgi:hypothetical protein
LPASKAIPINRFEEQTDHYKIMQEFCDDPARFVEAAIAE